MEPTRDPPPDAQAVNPGEITAPTAAVSSSTHRPSSLTELRAFPVQGWDRYEVIAFLGAGGMGRVFKARDPRLNRFVALKLIRGDDPELVSRLMREARAQARIDHEYVCKVYEVGDAEGHPYVAMQYVVGASLREARDEMTLEQKVEVIRKVACGLHAAHRTGLVHRDIKPTNIMLERDEAGELHPYIMDFGLACEVRTQSDGMTMTMAVEGTPSYMAPEQAKGERSLLDRRTDVYSLGATLYDLLGRRAPFIGTSSIAILLALVNEEPQPVRAIFRGVPADLETIVMKCLEKDPARRYDSAKALADDLQRFLDGEPVLARKAGLGYRLAKRAKKHKALVALGGATLVSVALLGGAWIRAKLSAAEQARISQQLGQDVTKMETAMRIAYSLPLHDARREKAALHEKMTEVERRMNELSTTSGGPGRYALGRGHLALHEYEEAVADLTAARDAGYHGLDVTLALGQALGGVYAGALRDAERIKDKDRRGARVKEAEARYLEPALRYLRESAGSYAESRAYMEGLIAFYEKRYDEALKKASQAFEEAPWLYEAKKLEADVHFAVGRGAHGRAEHEAARASYLRAIDALWIAADIARSDADLHDMEADLWIEMMDVERRVGASPRPSFERALAALDRALAASPSRSGPYSKKAYAFFRIGDYQERMNEDPSASLDKGLEAANEAVRLNPSDAFAFESIALLHNVRVGHEVTQGRDPRPWLARQAESLREALRLNPNYAKAWNDLGRVHANGADYELAHGIDPTASVERSIEMFNHAMASDPAYIHPYGNVCFALLFQAQYELTHGRDPRPSLARSAAACDKGLAIAPGFHGLHTNLSFNHLLRAQYELAVGIDPRGSADRAIESAAAAVKLNPKDIEAERYAASAYHVKALHARYSGGDPTEALRGASARLEASEAVSPTEPLTARLRGAIELTTARWEIHNGKSPEGALERARAALDLALKTNANDAETRLTIAELRLARASLGARIKGGLDADAAEGLAAVEKVLMINPHNARAMATRGAIFLAQARAAPPGKDRREAAMRAEGTLREALLEDANSERELRPLLDDAKRLSGETPAR